jgi:succinate dehydrogenase / fumarate reductase flavoprotein subunit
LHHKGVSDPFDTVAAQAAPASPATCTPTTGAGHTTPVVGLVGDQDAIEYMVRHAPEAVYELEHWGVPLSRTEDGAIYQRSSGHDDRRRAKGSAVHCAAADCARAKDARQALRHSPNSTSVLRHRPD